MITPRIEHLNDMARMQSAPGFEAFMLWLKESHAALVDRFHTAEDAQLATLRDQANQLREIIKTIETAADTVRKAEHYKEILQ
jgi:uncharacterized protein YdcH (DUF465 family)